MLNKLTGKFASPEHAGPADIAAFLGISDDEEIEIIKRDAFEQIKSFIEILS